MHVVVHVVYLTQTHIMDMVHVPQDYDQVSENVRIFSAQRFTELIQQLQPHVAEALADPQGLHDLEPGRILAHVALTKLQVTLIKELGALYRVQQEPRREDEAAIPAAKVEQMLLTAQLEAEARIAAAVEQAAADARAAVVAELSQREQLSLEQARTRVAASLERLKQR